MANKINSILIGLAMIGLITVGITAYKVIRRIDDQVRAIQKWVGAIDSAVAQSEKLSQVDRKILRGLLLDRARVDQSKQSGTVQPTITLYGDDSCGPCVDWYRNVAPQWESQGWIVKKESAEANRPRPYFKVFDGTREFWVNETLTMDSYNRASMKGISSARSDAMGK